ncbi:hypothetical protein [Rhizobium sp. BK491]|uniref:hypothetical protein n=1 Tax=Rhizobium sp. BK491 TaxID=2587009 RepID=UPI001617E113|nr:hypothetical protein [Rhizobium sp. BK491]MBB3568740.1 hypothetical protein [Rhizobium sp. BK491]
MTPAERARQIDRQEFEAECVAIRQRAYAMLMRKPARDPRVDQWIKRGMEPAVASFKPQMTASNRTVSPNFRRPATMHEAFGREQSLDQWAQEYGIRRGTLRTRLKLGWTLEAALRKPPGQTGRRVHLPRPGVPSDFAPSRETGAWGTAQETPNITFSGIEA